MQAHPSLLTVGQRKEKTLRHMTPRAVLRKGTPVLMAVVTLAGLTLYGAGAAAAQGPPQHSGNVKYRRHDQRVRHRPDGRVLMGPHRRQPRRRWGNTAVLERPRRQHRPQHVRFVLHEPDPTRARQRVVGLRPERPLLRREPQLRASRSSTGSMTTRACSRLRHLAT